MDASFTCKENKMDIPQRRTGEGITFDDILEQVGAFGKSQLRVFLLTSLFDVPLNWLVLFFLFGGANPGWYCVSQEGTAYLNVTQTGSVEDVYQILENDTALWAEGVCSLNGTKCDSIIFKGGYITVVTEFSLVCTMGYVTTLCTTFLMAGILVGASVGGQLADIYGRRPILIGATVFLILCQLCQSFSPNWKVFTAIRFIGGLSAGATLVVNFVIPMEIIGERWRTLCGCAGLWQLGSISFSGLAYLIPNWRHLSLATALISAPLLLQFVVVPESPRWLVQKDRIPEATKILRSMALLNGRPPPEENALYAISERDKNPKIYTLMDLFRSRTSTIHVLIMYFLWFTCAVTYYGLAISVQSLQLAGSIYINILIMGVAELFMSLTVIYSAYRLGRRFALLGYLVMATVSLATVVGLSVTGTAPAARNVMSAVGRAAVVSSWGIAYLLSAELFPTVVRSLASGSCSVAGRVGGTLAPLIAYLSFLHVAIPGFIYLSLTVSCVVAVFIFLPETKGKPLPDVLAQKRGCCTPEPETDDLELDAKEMDDHGTAML